MAEELEIERKFLVEFPDLKKLDKHYSDVSPPWEE